MVELKPCPFCGREPAVHEDKYDDFNISCPDLDCPASNNVWYESREEAIKAWNTRAERTCKEVTVDRFFRGCGECGYSWEYMYGIGMRERPNYCPNCGARVVNE